MAEKKWELVHRTLQLESQWVTVYSDKLLDDKGQELEYWHYDRPDSVVVIAVQSGKFVLPPKQYRVGVDAITLDFAGSRVDAELGPAATAEKVVVRELGVEKTAIESLTPINKEPFAVDSSFSSQKIWGFVARLKDTVSLANGVITYNMADSNTLRQDLQCGQCRLLLDEYLLSKNQAAN